MHAVAIWMDWLLDDEHVISGQPLPNNAPTPFKSGTHLVEPPVLVVIVLIGCPLAHSFILRVVEFESGLYVFPSPVAVKPSTSALRFTVDFDDTKGDFEFDFTSWPIENQST